MPNKKKRETTTGSRGVCHEPVQKLAGWNGEAREGQGGRGDAWSRRGGRKGELGNDHSQNERRVTPGKVGAS